MRRQKARRVIGLVSRVFCFCGCTHCTQCTACTHCCSYCTYHGLLWPTVPSCGPYYPAHFVHGMVNYAGILVAGLTCRSSLGCSAVMPLILIHCLLLYKSGATSMSTQLQLDALVRIASCSHAITLARSLRHAQHAGTPGRPYAHVSIPAPAPRALIHLFWLHGGPIPHAGSREGFFGGSIWRRPYQRKQFGTERVTGRGIRAPPWRSSLMQTPAFRISVVFSTY